jgi:hypothetical protein
MELVSVIEIVVWLAVGSVALYGLHCLGRWMEAKGWISSRRTSGSTAAGSAMLELQAILDPSTRHVIELKHEERKNEDDAGDPPVSEGRAGL